MIDLSQLEKGNWVTSMTKDEALALEAGRVLDLAIAEKVFGLYVTSRPKADVFFYQRDNKNFDESKVVYESEVPHYSTDIAAAWTVVEKMHECDFTTQRMHRTGGKSSTTKGGWRVGLSDNEMGPDTAWCIADTLPLAICRCALQAVWKD